MILHDQTDVREMVYPQTYAKWHLTDRELASMLHINYYPFSTDGRDLMEILKQKFLEFGDEESPCEFTAFEGEFLGRNIRVKILEPEANTRLLGPASWNSIYINDGNIVGVPDTDVKDELSLETVQHGIPLGITYMDGVIAKACYKIEEMIVGGETESEIRTTLAKSLSDVNLKLEEVALNYITSNNKLIDIRGPIFSTIGLEVID